VWNVRTQGNDVVILNQKRDRRKEISNLIKNDGGDSGGEYETAHKLLL
jgi:hypothetical protein